VMSADIPNAYIQAELPPTPEGEDRILVKIQGELAELLKKVAPDYYAPFTVMERGVETIYCEVTMGLYGMLIAGLNWYKKFSGDLIKEGYEKNPYDPCVCNKMVTCGDATAQHTVKFHVDDLMAGVEVAQINTDFMKWLNLKYGNHGEVKCTRGKVHDYLGMTLDFTKVGEVAVDMADYVASMIDESPFSIGSKAAPTPAGEDLFAQDEKSPLLSEKKTEFHTLVTKGLFVC